jgi:hypothetical protein
VDAPSAAAGQPPGRGMPSAAARSRSGRSASSWAVSGRLRASCDGGGAR